MDGTTDYSKRGSTWRMLGCPFLHLFNLWITTDFEIENNFKNKLLRSSVKEVKNNQVHEIIDVFCGIT